MRFPLLLFASIILMLTTVSAFAEWKYLVPGNGDENIHRAFTFAEKGDDRLEFACNTKRRDFFYSASLAVSRPDLDRLKTGEPTILIRLGAAGLVALDADSAYREGGRLIFVTAVKPAFINDLGKARQSVVAGIKADGKIVRQGLFPIVGLQAAMKGLAAGCGF